MSNEFSRLPSVDALLSGEHVHSLLEEYPHDLLVEMFREELDAARKNIASGGQSPSEKQIVKAVSDKMAVLSQAGPLPVINATGVILHTNLGRAPLSADTLVAMENAAVNYSNLEFNLDSGKRGSRHTHIEPLLCRLTGAEAALVVNNNASAVFLCLTALARRKEVIVSRGEAVEIGGSFRIPDVMRQSGAKLVEVGTTNRTYITDYEEAITERTAALMRVHSSNFRVVGFTHSIDIAELAELGKKHGLPVIDDLGSGCLLDTTAFGLSKEPIVQESIAAGVGLACVSGDKLLGGPQAGIILGRKELVDRVKRHPLARAVRIDKMSLAGLSATLVHYLKGEALTKVPIWRMISASVEDLAARAALWAGALGEAATVIDGESTVGGGSLPGETLPTRLVAVRGARVQSLANRLRRNSRCPVIGRINENVFLLDPRTVLPEEDGLVIDILHDTARYL